jgi:putative transposase
MLRDITVIPFRQPDAVDDPLSEVAREGARRMLAQVLIAEADAFVALWKDSTSPSAALEDIYFTNWNFLG